MKSVVFGPLILMSTLLAATSKAANIESIQMLTAQAGWSANQNALFWTGDGGLHWQEITPQTGFSVRPVSVFFLDTASGWVLLVHQIPKSGDKQGHCIETMAICEPLFYLASTTNSGTSWSINPLIIPDPEPSRGLSDHEGWVDFVDSAHGWVMVRMNGDTNYSRGVLLATQDGGKSWTQPPGGPPIAEAPRFLTARQGWLAGGPTVERGIAFYSTADGGTSWQTIPLKAPQQLQPTASIDRIYSLVVQDSQHLFLPVAFRQPDEKQPTLVLFGSNNGGQTWEQAATLPNYTSASETTVAGSTWITASISGSTVTLAKVTLGTAPATTVTVSATIGRTSGGSAESQLSFATDTQGWMLASGTLLATTNGGFTWNDVSPIQARAAVYLPGALNRAPDTWTRTWCGTPRSDREREMKLAVAVVRRRRVTRAALLE